MKRVTAKSLGKAGLKVLRSLKTIQRVLIVLLVLARVIAPWVLEGVVNDRLARLEGYRGRVGDVDLALWRGTLYFDDLVVVKLDSPVPVPALFIPRIRAALDWRALLSGAIVAKVHLQSPVLRFVDAPTKAGQQLKPPPNLRQVVESLAPLDLNRLEIDDGRVHFQNFHARPRIDLFIRDLTVDAQNLRNVVDPRALLPSTIQAHARFGQARTEAVFSLLMRVNPLLSPPQFMLEAEMKNLHLPELNPFLKNYATLDVERGRSELFVEAATARGRITGYVKPFIENLEVVDFKKDLNEDSPIQFVWENIVGTVADVFKNDGTQAARIPFSGNWKDPSVGLWSTIVSIFRHAFVQALRPKIEQSLNPAVLKSLKKAPRSAR